MGGSGRTALLFLARVGLTDFFRPAQYKDMCNSHVDRVARREALLDRMHEKGVIQADQMRAFQEQRQTMADARRAEFLAKKTESAVKDSKTAVTVSQQVKLMKEEELAKKKLAIDTAQQEAAARRQEQLKLNNTMRSPHSPTLAKNQPKKEEGGNWMSVVSSVAVAMGAAAFCYMVRR